MEGKITYHKQVSYCGKPRCRRCREGIGHGPYWYAYQTINGRTVRTYVGKDLPVEIQMAGASEDIREPEAAELAEVVVRLYVLGQFTLERRNGQHWQPVTDGTLQHQRVRSLLACLISSAGRKLGREQAIEMLWPDLDFETASHRLDKAVHSLRQLFEPGRSRPATSSLLLTEHQVLILAEQTWLWIDADAFEALLAQARASNDPGRTEQLLEEAMLLYGGDYLPEERAIDWIQTRRESLQRSWIGLLLELADLRIAREALPAAIDTLDRLLAIDPTNEAAVQRLIVLLAQSGRRAEAMRIYQRFATVLKEEYKIAPLPETRMLYKQVQRGDRVEGEREGRPSTLKVDAVTGNQGRSAWHEEGDERKGEREGHLSLADAGVGRSNQSPLVGREQELEILRGLLITTEQARRLKLAGQKRVSSLAHLTLESRQHPQCVLLMGDVGIGKTRLAEELGREARRRGWTVTWTRAYAQESTIPYRMWTETMRKAMSQGLWQRQEVTRRPLIYQALRVLLPELDDLLPQTLVSPPLLPEQEQLRLWEAARSLLTTISESAPMLIVLDDLQWADSSSCELLAYLVRQLRGYPILLAGTCRDIELPSSHPLRSILNDLQREQAAQAITVEPLTDEQIRALVSPLPEPVVRHIQNLAAGNPFLAEELAHNVDTHSMASDEAPDQALSLPDTIAAVLDLRLGRISSACQRLLVRAAVLGGSFAFHTLRAMEAGGTSDEDTILDLLEEALQAGMLTEEGSGTRITYHFWHPLLVSHLYNGLSAGRRASLHRRAAEVLQQTYTGREEEGAAAIAYHLVNGGAASAHIAYYALLAGDRAYRLSAYPEAEKHYRLAVEHIGTLPENADWNERLRLANLLERLGESTRVQGKTQEARRSFEQALEVRGQRGFSSSQADPQYEAQIDALLWIEIGKTWYGTGDNAQAKHCYDRAEQVLREARVASGPAWASFHLQRGYVLWQEGNFEEARQTAHQALTMFENALQQQNKVAINAYHATATRRTLAGDPVDLGRTHTLLAAIAATVGESATALDHLNTALAIFEQYDRQREIAHVCCNLGDLYLRRAEYTLAQAALRRSLSIAEPMGDIPGMSVAFGNLGMLSARFGDLSEAEAYYRRALALAEQVNDPVYISLWHSYLAAALQDQGRLDEAKASLRQALAASRATNITPCTGFALVVLGQLRIAQALLMQRSNASSPGAAKEQRSASYLHLLQRARTSLQRALALEGLEAETRTEGQLALAQASLLLGEIDTAQQQAQQAMEEAAGYEQTWLLARALRFLGSILAVRGQMEQAEIYFKQALEILQKCDMRLEWARALQGYGETLLQRTSTGNIEHQQGLQCLQEAHQALHSCNAALDLQIVEHMLSTYTPHKTSPLRN